MTTRIRVVDFSRYPYGRYRVQGNYSGERFRDEFLLPALRRGEPVEVDLDGVRGYGSSFLEETFGGLVRAGISADVLAQRMKILSTEDPSLIQEVSEYIQDAAVKARHAPA